MPGDAERKYETPEESEKRFRSLARFAPVGLFLTDPQGHCLFVNERWCEMAGLTPAEAQGEGWARALHPEDRERVIEEWYAAAASGREFASEYRVRTPAGKVTWLSGSAAALRDQAGQVVEYLGTVTDITALKEAEARRAAMLDTALDAIITMDHEGRIVEFNTAAERIFGYPREEALGQQLAELIIPSALREQHYRGLTRYLETGEAPVLGRRLELTAIRADGTEFPVELAITRISIEGPPLFTGYLRDISQQKRAARRLAVEHTMTRILSEAATLQEAAPRILEALCECGECRVSGLWEVDEQQHPQAPHTHLRGYPAPVARAGTRLRCLAVWSSAQTEEIERFQAASRGMTFAPGVGLPGRVWREKKVSTIRELSEDQNFPQLPFAQAAGLQGAMAFPLMAGEEFFGVIELLTERLFEPDPELLEMMTAIGQDIGQFIRRRRAEAALAAERERLRVTLASIGDAVIVTDPGGRPVFLNPVAETLMGWSQQDAAGKRLEEVFRIVNEETRRPAENPVERALREGVVVGLANHTVLLARDGSERAIDDSAAPIVDEQGVVVGVVLVFRDVTERRRAEETRSRLAAIVESSDVAIFSKDLEGIVTSWNRAAERLYGYSAAEMIGQPITRVIPPDRVDEFPALMERLRRGEHIEQYETERIRKDGARIDVLVNLSPMQSRSGRITGASVIARDITQTKRMADTLRESEARFRHLFESSRAVMNTVAEGLYTVDAQGLVTYVNPAAEALFGWTSAELMGRKMHDVTHYLHPDGTPFPAEECAGLQVLRSGVVLQEYEDVFIRKDGSFFPVVYSAAPLTENGKAVGIVVSFRDDTLRRRHEQEQRAVMASARCLLWYADVWDSGREDLHWDVRPVNEEAAQRLLPLEIPPGKTFAIAWSESRLPEDKARMDAYANRVVREGRSYTQDFRCRNVYGEVRWLHEDVRIETVSPGRWRAVGVTTDITERKVAEEALQEAARRKDEFLAMLAHELRNPLTPVRNALHMLRLQAGDAAAVDRWRDTMERQVRHMSRLIDDLLDVSRISRGRISLQRERLDLRRLVQLNVEDHRGAVEAAALSLELRLPETPVWVMADATRLTQVLDNLLENARKFTERDGHIRIDLTASASEEQAIITVADTGIGIEPEMLPHLFDVFSQADRSLDRSRGGLGLGLALVKGLMDLHGGSVEARSAGVGKGAEFILRLPLEPEPRILTERREAMATRAGGLRIVVIEDNLDAAETLQELLEAYGHQVSVAHTGPAGLRIAAAERPDVILCDIGLPGMDGYQVAHTLRQMPPFAETRLIAVTGYGQEGDVERSQSAGFNDHLVKPVDPDHLLNTLQPHR
jgi:PAS domain S-box-containing protein